VTILFLTLVTVNDIEENGIYTDLLRQFRDNGHSVYIVCPIEKRYGSDTEFTCDKGVHILRVKVGNITKTNIIEKGISTITLQTFFLQAIKKYMNPALFDLIIYSTPPITLERVIKYIKKKSNAKTYLLLKDIFPQNAVDLQIIHKSSPIYWYFRRKEKELYQLSDYIGCMSQANVEYLINNNPYLSSKKIEVCPNSIEPIHIVKDENKKEEIRKKYNIPLNKSIFIYGGNLGKPQGIDFLIECLVYNEYNENAYFLIIGSGTEYKKLQEYFNNNKPRNAKLFNQLPKKEYDEIVSACDVGLIFLDRRFTIPNFPSRLLSYMQSYMPIIAATDQNTDVGKIIEEAEFGHWCLSGDVKSFFEKVKELCNAVTREIKGMNARRYLENNYTAKHSYEIIIKHF